MNNRIKEILETRKTVLQKHIDLDKKCIDDPYLNQFMEGRVEIEESWLEETEKLLTSIFDSKSLGEILLNRRAILKTLINDSKTRPLGAQGQAMRGKTAVNTHWLEETEILIKSLDK